MVWLDMLSLLLLCSTHEAQASVYTNNSAGLTAVPTNIPATAVVVNLQENELTAITNTDFPLLFQLNQLYLSKNQISWISPDAFNNTPLSHLDLSHNPIKTVPFFPALVTSLKVLTMQNCTISNATWDQEVLYSQLVYLRLHQNKITTVPNLTRSASTIFTLHLADNTIETLEAGKLAGCNLLYWLSISSNSLKHVNGVLELPSFGYFNLQNNSLTHFPNISKMPNLGVLNLVKNQISSIPNGSFVNNAKLATLLLQENRLSNMPNLNGLENSLKRLTLGLNHNITSIPDDYFKGFNQLKAFDFGQNYAITSITFARSLGPSLEDLLMNGNTIASVPAGTFNNATGMKQISLDGNAITDFDMSNIQYMPHLTRLNLWANKLTKLRNAYTYCRGVSCTSLRIDLRNNPLVCDKNICWAKYNTTITVTSNACSGIPWNSVTMAHLGCPSNEEVLKLTEKREFAGTFANYELTPFDYKKIELGETIFMNCVGTCLITEGCHYFKHGNRTTTNGIDHKDTKKCSIWTLET